MRIAYIIRMLIVYEDRIGMGSQEKEGGDWEKSII